ncbi:MAG: phosphocholine cytidylyltransferase family protein [Candidatus Nitrosopelagicus sp.]|nr:phosphocholine cytidylyltransferase family protein [Candidatus Nitrosopelagicus sp.]
MRAIILAAGSGLRLGQHTKDIPKALLDINGKSILERQISLLRQHGINEIFVVTGYQREKHTLKDIEYIFNPRYAETEQLASVMVARTKIFDDVLVIFGDIIFDKQILQQILASTDDIAIAIDLDWEKSYDERPDNPKSLADKVLVKQKKILQVSAKITSLDTKNNEIGEFLGIIKLSTNGSKIMVEKYEELESSHRGKFHDADSLDKAKLVDILQELIDSEIEISSIAITGRWCEIDTPKDLERARKIFQSVDT